MSLIAISQKSKTDRELFSRYYHEDIDVTTILNDMK